MYSKQESSKLRQEFWASFGQYMSPVLSADGEKINWINYKTGERNISFRLDADNKKASVSIELSHPDPEIQQIYYDQLLQLQKILHDVLGEKWNWQLHAEDENGKLFSGASIIKDDCSILKKEDWPALISFFKPRIIALDEFWSSAKYSFEALR